LYSSLCIRAINVFGEYCASAKITTLDKFHFKYGKIQARIKAPFGAGIWPAFWALGINTRTPGSGWPLSRRNRHYGVMG
jgi:beta-glucanase (GH16 family)